MNVRILLALCIAPIASAYGAPDAPTLHLSYLGKTSVLSADKIAAMPHVEVTAMNAHEKQSHRYSGVPVRDLLASIGAPLGEKLRGGALGLVVVFRAHDGYAVTYALAEFDDAFSDRTILLVDRQDGKPLPEGEGPLRIVAPGDKRPARWARMVTALEVVPAAQ
jgi:hypothetical protein